MIIEKYEYMNSLVQQTPNPEAQDPEAVPPLRAHSADVKQVPFRPLVPEHLELANRTMENREKTVRKKSILFKVWLTRRHVKLDETYNHCFI